MENNESKIMSTLTEPRIPLHYVKIPKEVIWQSGLPEHRISALLYLNYHQTWEGTVNYSPVHMIQWSGYQANWRSSKQRAGENIYEKFKRCMIWYGYNGYINNFEKERFVTNNLQTSSVNVRKLAPHKDYGLICDFELEAIMKYESAYRPLNRSILLLLLAYIRAFTWTRSQTKCERDMPEICSSQFTAMEKFIGVSAKLISRATDVLCELGVMKVYRMPKYQDAAGIWHTNEIIYICPYKLIVDQKTKKLRLCSQDEYNWRKELEKGIHYLQLHN